MRTGTSAGMEETDTMEKKRKQKMTGHLLALATISVWGVTFIASKILLAYYNPAQIILMRFCIAYIILVIATILNKDKIGTGKPRNWKDEAGFFVLGITGGSLYFLCENQALVYTLATNVSIILSAAPILTAICAHFFLHDEKMRKEIMTGFIVSFAGVMLVVFNGTFVLKLNPLGDTLSIGAAICWAVYSVMLKNYLHRYDNVYITRKVMFYGMLTTIPMIAAYGGSFDFRALLKPSVILCLLILGILGSCVCYIAWNIAIKYIGVVTTNNYIYFSPFVTMLAAAAVLGEKVTPIGLIGAVLITCGVIISEKKQSGIAAGSDNKGRGGYTYEDKNG